MLDEHRSAVGTERTQDGHCPPGHASSAVTAATSTTLEEPAQGTDSNYGRRSFASVWLVLPGDGLLAGNAAAGWAGEARQADDLPVDQRSELGEAVHQWMLTAGPERQDVAGLNEAVGLAVRAARSSRSWRMLSAIWRPYRLMVPRRQIDLCCATPSTGVKGTLPIQNGGSRATAATSDRHLA
jgi:hypothetical protein